MRNFRKQKTGQLVLAAATAVMLLQSGVAAQEEVQGPQLQKVTQEADLQETQPQAAAQEEAVQETQSQTSTEEANVQEMQSESTTQKPEAESGMLSAPEDSSDSAAQSIWETASETLTWDPEWEYASFSAIHTDSVTLYRSSSANRKEHIVAVNAGHGTSGGSSYYTLCHPDGSTKVTGGSTAAGSTEATAVSYGTTFLDGTAEADATLELAVLVKEELLSAGYDVLMIRESEDCQLDNIARTVFANQYADCHISLHYDSTETDKGFFYISVPDVASYRAMEPVASHWEEHQALGEAILAGMQQEGVKICGSGSMAIDLTQTSYSTIPTVDLEVGDRASDRSADTLAKLTAGIAEGVERYFAE